MSGTNRTNKYSREGFTLSSVKSTGLVVANILLPITPSSWPQGFCPATWQDALNTIAASLQVVLTNGRNFYNVGPSKPPPELQNYPWLNQNDMRWYRFEGSWISPHEDEALVATDWQDFPNEQAIWSWGGGDGQDPTINPPTDRSGAMWIKDVRYDGRSPMSPGLIKDSNPANKTLGYQEEFGEGSHLQLTEEVGKHIHVPDPKTIVGSGVGGPGLVFGGTGPAQPDLKVQENTYVAGQQRMNITHPVRGQVAIIRTGRIYRVIL